MASKFIPIVGDLNEEALALFVEALHKADSGRGPIIVQISSAGGIVGVGTAMYELLRTTTNQVITIGAGEVCSMAVLVLMAGDYRILTRGTTVLLHDGAVHIDNTLMKANAQISEQLREHRWYCNEIAVRSGMAYKDVFALAEKESFFTAETAVELGLADAVKSYRKIQTVKFPRLK